MRLPTAAGAAASATPPAKTAKSSTAATAAGAAAESPAAEHATDHGSDPPAAASSAAAGSASSDGSDDMDDEENEDEDGPNREGRGIVVARLDRRGWRSSGKRYAAIGGDVFGELPSGNFDSGAVISLAEKGNHGAASVTRARVVDDGLETVADFGPIFAFRWCDQEEDAAIVFFAADAELFEELVAVLLDSFPFERAHRDDGHLRAGFLFELGAEIFEAGLGVRANYTGQVGNVAGGMDIFQFFRGSSEREKKKKENNSRCKNSRRAPRVDGRSKRHARTTIGGAREPVKRGAVERMSSAARF